MEKVMFSYDEIRNTVVYENAVEIEFKDGTSVIIDKMKYSPAIRYCSEERLGVRR
jgi:hypothetical protein